MDVTRVPLTGNLLYPEDEPPDWTRRIALLALLGTAVMGIGLAVLHLRLQSLQETLASQQTAIARLLEPRPAVVAASPRDSRHAFHCAAEAKW